MKNGDRVGETQWREQADEGGCADWGIAFARIPSAPQREPSTRSEKVIATIALILLASGAAWLLASEGRFLWSL